MFVYERMSKYTNKITEDMPINKIFPYFDENDYEILPVVDDVNRIVGGITRKVIEDIKPSKMLYIFGGMKVKEVIQSNTFSVNRNKTIEEAALLIKENHIEVLFVTDENDRFEGLITKSDVFKAFIDIMGLKTKRTSFVLKKEEDGNIGEISDISKNYNVKNILKCSTKRGTEFILSVEESDTQNLENTLKEYKYKIIAKNSFR